MVKCVLLFLFLNLISCSKKDENSENILTEFTQTGKISKFERAGEILIPDTVSSGIWIMKIDKVSVWGIDGYIPQNFMIKPQNSVAVLGKAADLPQVLALEFSRIIVKPDFPAEKVWGIIEKFNGILNSVSENEKIVLTTDGVFWHKLF
jgi:hypothetical protein